MKNHRVNFGYGYSPKWYTLRGAKIAATRFMKANSFPYITICRFEGGRPVDSFCHFLKDKT